MDAKKKVKKVPLEVVATPGEVTDAVIGEPAAAAEPETATGDVTIEELPGGGTREYPTSKRRYS